MPNQEQVKKFIEALEDAGYTPKSYSGRGMFGKECVSVHSSHSFDGEKLSAWNVARELFSQELDFVVPEPRQDSLGLGIVLYWPSYEWPKEGE